MSELERSSGGVPASTGDDSATSDALAGQPVAYVLRDYSHARSWELIRLATRDWAAGIAGPKIRDPHTGEERYYWNCDVRRSRDEPGPGSKPHGAKYSLWVFGKGGLAVAAGETSQFVERNDSTAWRTERWAIPIDEESVRSAHLASGRPNTTSDRTPASDAMAVEAASRVTRFVPARIASSFGNLPAETQLHLLEPFLIDDRRPQRGDLDAIVEVVGNRYEERYTCYLFNARWVAFVAAVRSVPYTSGAVGPALWFRSPESAAIRNAAWVVSAWFGPVARTIGGNIVSAR